MLHGAITGDALGNGSSITGVSSYEGIVASFLFYTPRSDSVTDTLFFISCKWNRRFISEK